MECALARLFQCLAYIKKFPVDVKTMANFTGMKEEDIKESLPSRFYIVKNNMIERNDQDGVQ